MLGYRALAGLMAGVTALATSLAAPVARAQSEEAEAFYKGRTLNFVIGHEAGTGYDLYGRALARHLGRHIPGQPSVVPQNLLGGGGLHAANWLATVAPRDGGTVAVFAHTAVLEPLLGDGKIKFDSARFSWIGNMDETVSNCVAWAPAGITDVETLLGPKTIFGGSGGPLTQFPAAVINLMGAKGKLVQGYKGSADVRLAMTRGEVNAACGLSLSTIKTQWMSEIEAGRIKVVLQFGRKPHPELKGVAHAYALAKGEEERAVYDLIFGSTSLGRPLAAPQGVPPERVRALRAAFEKTMSDPAFQADARQTKLDISPMTGEEVEKLVAGFFASSKAVIERAKQAVKVN